MCACIHATAISRKVVRKSACDNPERYYGWFWVHCSSNTFARMAREAMELCLRLLRESNKSEFDSYIVRKSVSIISHITFWVCRMHTFSDNLSQNSCIWDNTVSGSFHEQTPSGREKGVCTVILLRLHPASLTHKNPTRRAIIYGMRAIGRKEQSIDLKVFW